MILTTFIAASNSHLLAQTDTLICDNGGFEDDFDFYFGSIATYYNGGNTCSPLDQSGNPSTWSSINMPTSQRFQIVSSGTDPLVGISTTKFGNKAIRLNNHQGHQFSPCLGHRDVNKLTKRFKVTAENAQFTIWYAVVLENPDNHDDSQPFFSIKCDLAPEDDLCFDANELDCPMLFEHICDFDSIKVVDWSCHRIKIPDSLIGEVATLEIIAADCGCGGHFGYAYVDGICVDCYGSALGSASLFDATFNGNVGIKYFSCNTNKITVCGTFNLPLECGSWELDSISIPGFHPYNMVIYHTQDEFCFDLPISDFQQYSCRELFAIAYFTYNDTIIIQQSSNSIEICYEDFLGYQTTVSVSSCYDNATTVFISDDYYYVTINLAANIGDTWFITRLLHEPVDNESGFHIIKNGSGGGTIILGPFLIQEGVWDLMIILDSCDFLHTIYPPDFCPECENFVELKLSGITCNDPGSPADDPTDDTWSFDLEVPFIGVSDDFELKIANISVGVFDYNGIHIITPGLISNGCLTYSIIDDVDEDCIVEFTICPPKPCSTGSDCDLEVYVKEYICDDGDFSVIIDVQNYNTANLCYRIQGNSPYQGSLTSFILGPYTSNIFLTVYLCNTPTCYKRIFIPLLDCDEDNFQGGSSTRVSNRLNISELRIIPNPVRNGEINIESKLSKTDFAIYSVTNQLIHKASFSGPIYHFSADLSPGVYFLNYKDSLGKSATLKFIKL
ncbi:MAG: T9SS type A sorting domain-containing protein [Saprospiraceae bacterium]|nr:T9SS type A sorting domain-containing protein [Saprospiraceae bacterium]